MNIDDLRQSVIEAARRITDERPLAHGETVSVTSAGAFAQLKAHIAALRTAEEAATKPKLRPYHEIIRAAQNAPPVQNQDCEIIDQTRADMMEAIRKLPTYYASASLQPGPKGEFGPATIEDAILLSDIEALAETAK